MRVTAAFLHEKMALDQRGQGSTAAGGAIAPRVVWPDGCLTAAHRVHATPVPVKHAFAGSPAAVRRRGVGVEGNIPDRSPLPRRLQERATPATRPSAGAHRLALGPPLPEPPECPRLRWRGPPSQLPSLAIVPPLARLAVRRASWSLRRAREGAGQRGVMKCLGFCSTSTKSMLPHSHMRTITNL